MRTNKQIATILSEMAAFYEMEGVAFKPRAYEKAAEAVGALDEDVGVMYKKRGEAALENISGVGKGIAHHLAMLIKGRKFLEYERLKKKTPVKIGELMAIEGVGPKMIKALWEKLGVKNIRDLERAAAAGKIRGIPHFGARSEENILRGIAFLKKSAGRAALGFVLPDIRALEDEIRSFPSVTHAVVAGSVRRRKETIGDIDILAVSSKPADVIKKFIVMGVVAHVYAAGSTKAAVRLQNGFDADLRVVPAESLGAALNYFTGSKAHNIALREIAVTKGLKLNEYGLFQVQKSKIKNQNDSIQSKSKEIKIAGETEEGLYEKLGLVYIEPELREDTGEIIAARVNTLPHLIGYGDLRGDLQVQTDWTDGENSIEDMARAAKAAGLEYIAITDHTMALAMTGGADEKKLAEQAHAIDRLNKKDIGIHLLKGAEVNIAKDGTLDIANDALARLDVVGASIHSHFKLSRAEQTRRIIRAMENPNVDIIFHLTGRLIGKRAPIDCNIDEIIAAAKRTGTILEINASPDRLDIKDEYVRKCVGAGVKMVIDSDAHSAHHFQYLELGIAQARRGWAEKKDVVNTRPLREFLKMLK